MAQGGWKQGKIMKLDNSLDISIWRQVLEKEQKQTKKKTLAELEAMKAELEGKNTYMHLFKNDDTLKKETVREK